MRLPQARLSTILLLIIIVGMAAAIVVQQRREERLLSALRSARSLNDEAIRLKLERPVVWRRPSRQPALEDIFRFINARSRENPDGVLLNGIPIYVDPKGLSEVGVTLSRLVKAPSTTATPMKVFLSDALGPFNLDYVVGEGLLTVTSKKRAEELRAARLPQPFPK